MSGAVMRNDADGIATLRLQNPAKLNAFTPEMLAALDGHLADLDRAPGLRGVVLAAAPSKAFCAGADITAWGDLSAEVFARTWVREGHRVFDRLARLSLPTVAAMGGHAFGGGLEFAAACDIRVIAPRATIALPEAQIGIVPGWGGTTRLARLIPEPTLKEMALFGRRLTAERAYALGFVCEITDDVEETARAVIPVASSRAVEAAKWMIHAAAGEDRAASVEALASGLMAATGDKAEGVAAFRAKRAPAFPPRGDT